MGEAGPRVQTQQDEHIWINEQRGDQMIILNVYLKFAKRLILSFSS